LEVGWQYLSAQSATNTLDHRGYTGQEQLDDLSLVHLNGRVYDPMTGRMTSPDPTIPDPYDLQSLNRASYVRNSPMDKVDPTGFFDVVTGSYIKPVEGAQGAGTGAAGTQSIQYADHSHDTKEPEAKVSTPGSMPLVNKAAPPPGAKGAGGGCGSACAVTGAEDGFHGLPSSTPRETQQAIDQVANGVAARGAPVAVATALFPELVASLASNPLGRAFLTMIGINLNLQAASDGLPMGGGFASNAATAPKLAAQLFKENLTNIANQDARLALAVSGKGNFSIGTGTAAESNALGKIWVGDGAKPMSGVSGGLVSADGRMTYRPPAAKSSSFATTGVQANFQQFSNGQMISNGHLNITP
jgi:RHS repeat-associated protein